MADPDVLEFLQRRVATGDKKFYTACEIHKLILREGKSLGYISVWRSTNQLWRTGYIEGKFDIHGLQRRAKFRAKILLKNSSLGRDNKYNKYKG